MSHGGARYGAGRPAIHVTAESCRRLDVRDLARAGVLVPGAETVWTWWRDMRGCSIAFNGNDLVLRHALAHRPMLQRVPILRTECHFGGTRPWFACPSCTRRAAVLFLAPMGFACRRCSNVAYASQREGEWGRAERLRLRAMETIGMRRIRPKGMHRKTHTAMLARLAVAKRRCIKAMVDFAAKLNPSPVWPEG